MSDGRMLFPPRDLAEFSAWRENEDKRIAMGLVEIPAQIEPVLMRGMRKRGRDAAVPLEVALYNLGRINSWAWDRDAGVGSVVVLLRSVFKFDGEVLVCDSPAAVSGWTDDQITAERLRWDNRELDRLGVVVSSLEFVE